jgi:hypothetical protein
MTTDYRALCAELAEILAEEYGVETEYENGDPLEGGVLDVLDRTRAALAQPEPVGPSHWDVCQWLEQQGHWGDNAHRIPRIANMVQGALARWGRPAITPIPVSERPWVQEGFCDAEGQCWWWHPDHKEDDFSDGWMLINSRWAICHHDSDGSPVYTHCLPHHALPLPPSDHH